MLERAREAFRFHARIQAHWMGGGLRQRQVRTGEFQVEKREVLGLQGLLKVEGPGMAGRGLPSLFENPELAESEHVRMPPHLPS